MVGKATVKSVAFIPWFSMLAAAKKSGVAFPMPLKRETNRFSSTWVWPIASRGVNSDVAPKNTTIFSKKPALD